MLRVERGSVTAEELAALVGALLLAGRRRPAATPAQVPGQWGTAWAGWRSAG